MKKILSNFILLLVWYNIELTAPTNPTLYDTFSLSLHPSLIFPFHMFLILPSPVDPTGFSIYIISGVSLPFLCRRHRTTTTTNKWSHLVVQKARVTLPFLCCRHRTTTTINKGSDLVVISSQVSLPFLCCRHRTTSDLVVQKANPLGEIKKQSRGIWLFLQDFKILRHARHWHVSYWHAQKFSPDSR